MKNRTRNRKSKKVSAFNRQRIKFAARKVMAITVSEQSLRRAITRPTPKRRLHCLNFLKVYFETCNRQWDIVNQGPLHQSFNKSSPT